MSGYFSILSCGRKTEKNIELMTRPSVNNNGQNIQGATEIVN